MKRVCLVTLLLYLVALVLEVAFNVKISDIKGISLRNISFYLLICLILIKYTIGYNNKKYFNSVDKCIIYFACYCIVLFIYNIFLNNKSFFSVFNIFFYLKMIIEPFMLFYFVTYLIESRRDMIFIINFLLMILLFFNAITLLGAFDLIDFSRSALGQKYGRADGALGEPNLYASYIVVFLPLILNKFVISTKIYKKIFLALQLFLSVYCLILTGSRGGWVAFVVGIFYLFMLGRKRSCLKKTGKNIYVIFILFFGCYVSCIFLPTLSKEGIENNVVSRFETQDIDSYSSGRLSLWKDALKSFVDNPLFGSSLAARRYAHSDIHNEFLSQLIYRGLLGLILFLLIFYFIYKKILDAYILYLDDSLYFLSYLAGFVSFLVSMIFVNMYTPIYFFFIYSGAVYNLAHIKDGSCCILETSSV